MAPGTPQENDADDQRVETRAELLPEEQAVGSEVPEEQAAAILAESDERTDDPEQTRRDYDQTPDPEAPDNPIGQQ